MPPTRVPLGLALTTVALAAPAWFGTGCGRTESGHEDHDAAGHTHAEHVHVAPHGGTLVPLGEHEFNLEWVRERNSDRLTAYVLDAHAENFVRLAARSFTVNLTGAAGGAPLTLEAVLDSRTGETIGDTSRFEVRSPGLASAGALECRLGEIEIRGRRYAGVPFHVP
jgi:hypothetical protein